MRLVKPLAAGLLCVACFGLPAIAADLVSLDWGKLTVEGESSIQPKTWDAKASTNSMQLSMTFDKLSAKADAKTVEGSTAFSGYFTVQQPNSVNIPSLRIEIKGNIVKTAGSTASIEVKVGNQQQVIEWPADQELAESFVKTINGSIEGGQLPNPFPISITATAKKSSETGAADITIESIDVDAGSSKVADRSH